jgi:hypothetical protein
MLIQDFFEAVDRVFRSAASGIAAPSCLDMKAPTELSLPTPKLHEPERRLAERRVPEPRRKR